MIGSLHIAEKRLHELLAKYGAAFLDEVTRELLDYSERFMRAEIREIPNGTYRAEDCMEDDGVSPNPYYMRLKLVVRDDEVIADWTHSDPQARGPINATFVVTAAATYSGLLHIISDDIPLNSGCYRPIHLVTTPIPLKSGDNSIRVVATPGRDAADLDAIAVFPAGKGAMPVAFAH